MRRIAILAGVCLLEIAFMAPLYFVSEQQSVRLVMLAIAVVLVAMTALLVLLDSGASYGSSRSSDINGMNPYMVNTQYFNNLAMRRDLDQIAQNTQQQSLIKRP
jgi:hypothetical protein